AAARWSERPASDQFEVPALAVGGSLQWTKTITDVLRLAAGIDGSWIDGTNHEDGRFMGGHFTQRTVEGSEQLLGGVWTQLLARPVPSLRVTAGLRIDGWRSFAGFTRVHALPGGALLEDEQLPTNDAVIAEPSLALRWQVLDDTALRAGAYRGFRAPTINELVRGFRVRDDITAPNPALEPETLYGGEVGVEQRWGRLEGELTAYWDVVQDPIANVTVALGPGNVAPCGFVPAGGVCRHRRHP